MNPLKSLHILLFFVIVGFLKAGNSDKTPSENHLTVLILQLQKADVFLNPKPDSAFLIYSEIMPVFEALKDTVGVLNCHIGLADVYKNKGQYSLAYDHLWDALILSKNKGDFQHMAKIHHDISALYGIFEKYDKSIEHLQEAVRISESLIGKKQLSRGALGSLYYSLAVQNRKGKNYKKALDYLDSCLLIGKSFSEDIERSIAFINAERGFISLQLNDMHQAEYHLFQARDYFVNKDLSFQVIILTFSGHFYLKSGVLEQAGDSFRKALIAIERFKTHADFRTEILKNLSKVYEKQNNIGAAFTSLKQANALTDSLFSVKSMFNNRLFQIKDKYRVTINDKNEKIKFQNSIIEKEQLNQSRLKILIGFILFVVLFLGVIMRLRYRMKKYQMDKSTVELQAKLDKEKSEMLVQFKSRELTAHTLQFIEKDQVIDELLGIIEEAAPERYQKVKSHFIKGNTDMWEQFNKQFIEVNAGFYQRLRAKHPDLTPTEHKHCALIKLRFDTKEMANLLSISLNSVQISRHRIRKKIKLERNENLSNYIADI